MVMMISQQDDCQTFLGARFREEIGSPAFMTDNEVARLLIARHILVHVSSGQDKFRTLIFMIVKLLLLACGDIQQDNMDVTTNHEVLLPGHLYLLIMKEKLNEWLQSCKIMMQKDAKDGKITKADLIDAVCTRVLTCCYP